MAEAKKKGRAPGSKVETYTYRASWKADTDGMAALRVAQEKLKGEGYKTTQQHIVEMAVQHCLSNLSPQEMVKLSVAALGAQRAAEEAKKLEKKRKKIEAQQKKLAEQLKLLGA